MHKYGELFDNPLPMKGGVYIKCHGCKQVYAQAFYASTHKFACQNTLSMLPGPSSDNAEFRDDVAFTEAQFRDGDGGFFADVVTTMQQSANCDDVVTTFSDDTSVHSSSTTLYDYEHSHSLSYLTDEAAATLLNVPNMMHRGTQRYVLRERDIQTKETSLQQLSKKEHASVIFWAAAQRGRMSTAASQMFVDAIITHSATLSQLPASLVTIRRDVARVAARTGSWIKRTADVITLQLPELRWHHDILFVYHDVIQCLADLLQDKALCGLNAAWEFKERRTADGRYRIFGELSDGYWWEDVEAQIPQDAFLCPVIFNTDETVMRFGGRASQKPMYDTAGNLSYESRKKDKGNQNINAVVSLWQRCIIRVLTHYCLAGKKVLGLFPKLHGSKIQTARLCFRNAKRRIYHKCWGYITDAVKRCQKEGGFWVSALPEFCSYKSHKLHRRFGAQTGSGVACFQLSVS